MHNICNPYYQGRNVTTPPNSKGDTSGQIAYVRENEKGEVYAVSVFYDKWAVSTIWPVNKVTLC